MRDFGTIRRLPSGRWQAYYWHEGSRHNAPGTFSLKVEASDWLAGARADINRGEWLDPAHGRRRLKDFAEANVKARTLAPNTRRQYRWLLDSYIIPELGSTPLADLTPTMVRDWHAAIPHKTTAAKAYRLLASLMNVAVTDQVILRSPCRVEGAGAENAPKRPTATPTKIAVLADAMPARTRLAVLLAHWCQMRKSEILEADTADVDLTELTVTIRRAKTPAGMRTLAIPAFILPELREHIKNHADPDGPLFTGRRGGRLAASILDRGWRAARESVGRPDLHLHDLRHSGLTLAATSGATIVELMYRAGHASPAAALRYQHATKERDRALADALSQQGKRARSAHGAKKSVRSSRQKTV